MKLNIASVLKQKQIDVQYILSCQENFPEVWEIELQLKKFASYKIVYSTHNGISNNLNNSIISADCEIIKILFQDDFIIDEFHLMKLNSIYKNSDTRWTVSGSCRFFEEFAEFRYKMIPKFSRKKILKGINTISSPSVISFLKKNNIMFDSRFTMYMDLDWYLRVHSIFGNPAIDKSISIANRVHNFQTTNLLSEDIIKKEFITFKEFYKNE